MIIRGQTLAHSHHSNYPHPFRALVAGRSRQRLGKAGGLKNFGVNLVRLEPGSWSAIRHWHSHEEELVYILAGELTLVTDAGKELLYPGDAAAFPAGEANGHHLINQTQQVALYLEIGDRHPEDRVIYPDVDLVAEKRDESWIFCHKNGEPY
ncbi:MAG: cupin domain-containing protein [Chloroflexaceae bacterium]|nr:cupin domain-containing protein [Chloroflexaceae bacterium]